MRDAHLAIPTSCPFDDRVHTSHERPLIGGLSKPTAVGRVETDGRRSRRINAFDSDSSAVGRFATRFSLSREAAFGHRAAQDTVLFWGISDRMGNSQLSRMNDNISPSRVSLGLSVCRTGTTERTNANSPGTPDGTASSICTEADVGLKMNVSLLVRS